MSGRSWQRVLCPQSMTTARDKRVRVNPSHILNAPGFSLLSGSLYYYRNTVLLLCSPLISEVYGFIAGNQPKAKGQMQILCPPHAAVTRYIYLVRSYSLASRCLKGGRTSFHCFRSSRWQLQLCGNFVLHVSCVTIIWHSHFRYILITRSNNYRVYCLFPPRLYKSPYIS